MKNLSIVLFALLLSGPTWPAQADDWTVQGSWVDVTPTGPEYVPIYATQCQVDSVAVFEDLGLSGPNFSVALTFDPSSVLECRWRNSNALVTPQIDGNWSAWMQGLVAQAPANPGTATLILIRQIP